MNLYPLGWIESNNVNSGFLKYLLTKLQQLYRWICTVSVIRMNFKLLLLSLYLVKCNDTEEYIFLTDKFNQFRFLNVKWQRSLFAIKD